MGVHLSADLYPYIAGSTMLSALLPPWASAGGGTATLARLSSAEGRARIRAALLDVADASWDNYWRSAGPEGIFLSDLHSPKHQRHLGKSLSEAAASVELRPEDFLLELLEAEGLGGTVLVFNQSEEVVDRLLRLPFVSVASDAILGGRPHPRTWGAFPRVLSRFTREKGSLTLSQAVRKMTGLPADIFGLRDHGYLEVGKRANVVLFDPEAVDDLATFDEPAQAPAGIPHVIVGGKLVLRDGQLTGQRPGVVVSR
jgi:N-acyl-D-aspartate/D-glutamate deacylase